MQAIRALPHLNRHTSMSSSPRVPLACALSAGALAALVAGLVWRRLHRSHAADAATCACTRDARTASSSPTCSGKRAEPGARADATTTHADADNGWRMPAEWELHEGCWMGFPSRLDTWPDGARPGQAAFAAVAAAISRFEPVTVCCPPGLWERAGECLAAAGAAERVRRVDMCQDDAWFRDTGPTFVVRRSSAGAGAGGGASRPAGVGGSRRAGKGVLGVDWEFNAWGEVCFGDWTRDARVARKVCAMERLPSRRPGIVLEGGSIHVDGQGTLLTTSECLLNPNRNPELSQADIERVLCRELGVSVVVWLPWGVHGDVDTSGHVDNMACFLAPGVVALHWTDDVEHPQHKRSQAALEVLMAARDACGRWFRVVKLLAPRGLVRTVEEVPDEEDEHGETIERSDGEEMPGSYVNFYMANGGVVVPQFGDKERDELALRVLRAELGIGGACAEASGGPREVVGVASRAILVGGGNIHCITQQQPVATLT